MRKLSVILLALFAIGALTALVVLAGCKQTAPAAPQLVQQGQSSTNAAPKSPDSAKHAPDISPPTTSQLAAPTAAEVAAVKKGGTRTAIIKTSYGDMVAKLYGADEPLTVANFIKLAKAHFYDGLTFHRVDKSPAGESELIQGGDPDGMGTGGPGYSIKLETSPKHTHDAGALAMARTNDPDSAGSQFYIAIEPHHYLDGQYAVFGTVIKNLDAAKKIVQGDKIISISIK